jgi:serine/threonine protein kinase
VIAALEEYVSALQAGQAPDRDAFQARHPEIAGVLAECLDGLQWLRDATLGGRPAAAEAPAGAGVAPGTSLGDYRILRELGRGGMGVVYEAIQLSLGRRVALKVLPFASTLDGRQLQRFKNEAQAAACLHHTNIVPVHATGCERGVHYYAMRFIDGRTLAELIAELRQQASRDSDDPQRTEPYTAVPPGPEAASGALLTPPPLSSLVLPAWSRRADTRPGAAATPPLAALSTLPSPREGAFYRLVARLGIQAAEALEHAHQLGVIHRDVKPGNLLLETGSPFTPSSALAEGEALRLWITDFGLAYCQSQAGLTMTGDLVGTLRYMSPEQALAKRVPLDHRTDIYSLGATLYELLTLEPVFPGRDRQELLRQIAFEEPKPPRQHNRAIPSELETIVLKALEKNPGDRYATAQELADDLRRYLEDRPILARRPNLLQRAGKCVRRHAGVTVTAGAALALLLVVASLGLFWNNLMIRREQGRTQAANDRLRDNLELSLKTLDEIYLKVLEVRLPRDREAAQENQELLTKALRFYEQFAERNEGDPRVRREVASAYDRAGVLHMRLGHHDKASAAMGRAEETATRLSTDFVGEPDLKGLLAEVHLHKGELALKGPHLLKQPGQTEAAEEEFRKGIEILEPLIENVSLDSKYWQTLADLHGSLASFVQHCGDLAAGEKHFRKAIAVQATIVDKAGNLSGRLFAMQQLAVWHANLGRLLGGGEWARRLDEAREELRQAVDLLNRVNTQAAALPGYQRGRVAVHGFLSQ